MAKFEAPIIQEWDFMTVWIFLKNKKICTEKVVKEQGLALQQLFPYKSS